MNAITTISAQSETDIVAIVDRARVALDEDDVQAALILSAAAYVDASTKAGFAEKVKASRKLIEKFRRLQRDALEVEGYAQIRLSEIVDEAQAKGQIATPGKRANILGGNISTLEDFGINAKQLYHARTIAKAERMNPGFVKRSTETLVEVGLEPTRAALKKAASHAIGTKAASKQERGDDLYETPIEAIRTLLALESFSLTVLEPSVGRGAILRPLEAAGYEVTIADFVDRGITTQYGEVQRVGDFLTSRRAGDDFDIVTNPPYGIANACIAHALREHRPRKMAMLLNSNFMFGCEDPDRLYVMDECPPSRIYANARRLPMMHRDGWDGEKASSQMNTAWFVWERNADGTYGSGYPQLIRVDIAKFRSAEPLAPGEGGNISPLTFMEPEEDLSRTTPRISPEERADKWIDVARKLFAGRKEGVTLIELRKQVSVGSGAAAAMVERLQREGFLGMPDADGRMPVLCDGADDQENGGGE